MNDIINENEIISEEEIQSTTRQLPKWVSYLFFALALICAFFAGRAVKEYVFIPVKISQTSMMSTLGDGDLIYVYRLDKGEQFDIVIIDEPLVNEHWIIKRIIAVGGQEVEIKDGILYITDNGVTTAYREEYVYGENIEQELIYIPEGYLYLLGDNRSASYDSSEYGCINADRVIGKAIMIPSEDAVVID